MEYQNYLSSLSPSLIKTKRRRSSAKQDLISKLTDEILIHILTFLPTLSVVATSVLSKRWKDIWISVPNLDFTGCWSLCRVKSVSIKNFIDRFLSLNNNVSCFRKIRLHSYREFKHSRVNAWISSIARCEAEEFDLNLYGKIYSIPHTFFHKEKLVTLKLQYAVVEVPPLVFFPNLKSMVLKSVEFPDDDSMKNLILGCPVLWSMDLFWHRPYDVRALYICSSTLYKLDLCIDYYSDEDFRFHSVIDTPNLSHLNVKDESGSTYEVINITSLVTASLGFVDNKISMEVLTKGVHLEELHLPDDRLGRFIDTSLPNLPIFHNLVRFTVKVWDGTSWNALPTLFHCMPKLVTVVFDMGYIDPCAWCDPNEVPRCFLYCIKNVEITNLIQGGQEIQMISYILQNAMVLKNLFIRDFSMKLEEENEFLKTLLTLPRSAVGCRVECGLELEVEM